MCDIRLSKEYLERTHKQAIREYRTALTEDDRFSALRVMAQVEYLAATEYGFAFSDELHSAV